MSETKKGLTRRDFIKGAAAVGAVGAASSLAMPAIAEAAVASAVPTTWDMTRDVVVIGSGCGLAAAIEAVNKGATAIVIEKADHTGGLFMAAGGGATMGGNNVVQQAAGVLDNDQQWFEDEMFTSQGRAVPEIVRTLVSKGAESVKFMTDLGLVFSSLSAGVLRGPINRGFSTPTQSPSVAAGGGGWAWTVVLEKKVRAQGTDILLNHKMLQVYRDGVGAVVGVQVQSPTGLLNIRANKGVVMAAGTWTDNNRMMQAYDPRLVGPDCYGDGGTPADGQLYIDSSGDGQRACQAVGAAVSDMSFPCYLYTFFGARSYWGWGHNPVNWANYSLKAGGKGQTMSAAGAQKTILVKNDGKRYINESESQRAIPEGMGSYSENPENPWTTAYLNLPQPRNVWQVADATTVAALNWPVAALQNPDPKVDKMFDPACIAIDATIDGLAAKMGINATNLKTTIERYNGFVTNGVDLDFGKPTPGGKILTGPFYGLKMSLIRHTQRNGLRVNTKMQVIQNEQGTSTHGVSIDQETTIPNLYAAGEDGDILGYRRAHNTLAHYITAARLSGINAALGTAAVTSMSFAAKAETVKLGSAVALTGALGSVPAGAKVAIDVLKPGATSFAAVGTFKVSKTGAVAAKFTPTKKGTYKFRSRIIGGKDALASTRKPVTVVVK